MDLRVFLVEDHRNMHALMGELFAAVGGLRLVGTATTEAEALLWLQDHPAQWDLGVVDLVLSEGSGMSVISRAKSTHPGGRAVVFSSYSTPAVRQHCLDLGADAVFHKGESAQFTEYCASLVGRIAPASTVTAGPP